MLYYILSSIVALVTLREDFQQSSTGYFTNEGLRHSFIDILVITTAYLICAYAVKSLDRAKLAAAIIVPGIYLRVCYTLFTDSGTRTYDVYRDAWGHLDYIRYIAEHFALPPVNDCQAYHPPVHHILSAFVLNISKLFTQKDFYQLKAIQLAMVLLSSLTLLLFYKILRELNCSCAATLTAVCLFAFHPTNIYFSSRINNDNTLLFFYTLSFYFLIKWFKSNSPRDMVLLSLSAAFAVLTKFSGILLVPLIAAAFIMTILKNRDRRMKVFRQYAFFGMIFLPLSMSYPFRNYILFNQPFGYVPFLGKGFTPTFRNLLYLPVGNIAKNPFNNGGLAGGEYFMEFFLKSSLFGEWQSPGLERLATAMLLLVAVLAILIAGYLAINLKSILKDIRLLLVLNLVIPILLEMKFRMDLPTACSQDFRYAAPILLSVSFFLGETVERLNSLKSGMPKRLAAACLLAFCALSSIFLFSLADIHIWG